MELKIKPCAGNTFSLGGILIRGASVALWLREIQAMQLPINEIEIYPAPGTTANSVWGCLVITRHKPDPRQAGLNELCQQVSPTLFIPERSLIHPPLSASEIEKIFHSSIHIIHPEFGLAELTEQLNLEEILLKPDQKSYFVITPQPPIFIPQQIKSFQVQPVSQEEVLKNLEENIFPKKEKMKDKPLNIFEKGKLGLYKLLFTKDKKEEGQAGETKKTESMSWLESFVNKISGKENKWAEKMQEDFEDLDRRNQKEIDKLMDMLKKDPWEALKYAIPLDESGTSRGGTTGEFTLFKRWDLSLLGGLLGSGTGGGSIDIGDNYFLLQKQYNETAEELIRQGEYQKAAFVYMKLLKNHFKAAETLEQGKYYQEAAMIWLKYLKNKKRAAECYEKGNMTIEAIGLYKELEENEKVGDLYLGINKKKEANLFFQKAADIHVGKSQYVKASLIFKHKMKNELKGQDILLDGWRTKKDSFNCLNNYFSNISDIRLLEQSINTVYAHEVNEGNREIFLQVMRHEYGKQNELAEHIKEIAYEVVAAQLAANPSIATELKGFNPGDKELLKDALRFKLNRKTK